MLTQILTVLTALAIPAALIAIVDDWFLRPRRRLAGGAAADAPLLAATHYALPLLLLAALLRLLLSERLDFSLVLVTVGVGAAQTRLPAEPVHEDRPLSAWTRDLKRGAAG